MELGCPSILLLQFTPTSQEGSGISFLMVLYGEHMLLLVLE